MTMFYASKLILISQSERSFYRQLVPNLTFFPGYFSMNSTEVIMPRYSMAGTSDPLVWLFILSVFHGQSVCKCLGSRRSLLLHNYGGSPGHRSLCSPLCPPPPCPQPFLSRILLIPWGHSPETCPTCSHFGCCLFLPAPAPRQSLSKRQRRPWGQGGWNLAFPSGKTNCLKVPPFAHSLVSLS